MDIRKFLRSYIPIDIMWKVKWKFHLSFVPFRMEHAVHARVVGQVRVASSSLVDFPDMLRNTLPIQRRHNDNHNNNSIVACVRVR